MEHRYKTWQGFFERLGPEDKTFEIRRKRLKHPCVVIWDVLIFEETRNGSRELTGRYKRADVGFVMNLFQMPELMEAQGAENRTNISEFEVFGLHNIEFYYPPTAGTQEDKG